MKFGVTQMPESNKQKNKDGVEFEYVVWFKTSDGKLHSFVATRGARLQGMIDMMLEQESKVRFDETSKEALKAEFLEQL